MTYSLQILHASDWEAGLLATQRAANFAAIVDKLEDAVPNSITLSTGDGWIPSPFFIAGADPQLAATYNGVYNQLYGLSGANAYSRLGASVGRADVTIQNIIGVQAAVFGNHEFDSGPTEVANIIGANLGAAAGAADDTWVGAQFPYLSVNLNFANEPALSGLVNPNVSPATFAQTGPTSTQTGTGADKIAKSTVITENGEQIAFIGATTQLEPLLTSLGRVTLDGFTGRDEIALLAEQINAEVDRVLAANPGLNKVIVGTHLQQLANEQALAPLLRNVDVLIGGGSHTLLSDSDDRLLPGDTSGGAYPQVFTNASGQPLLLVNTASEYSYVGRLNLTFDDAGVVIPGSVDPTTSGAVAVDDTTVAALYGSTAAAFTPGSKGYLVREVIEGLDADNDGVQETAGIADVIRQQDGNILGRTSVYLEGRRGEVRTEETNLGDLSADANLWYAQQYDDSVLVSIKNGGGIRDSIGSFSTAGGGTTELPPAANPAAGKQAGDISQLDVTNSLRFNNALAVVTLTAAELERVLEHGVAAVAPGATPGQFAQIGGISFSYDATRQSQALDVNGVVTREGQRVVSAAIIDAGGDVIDTLVRDGQIVGDPNRTIRAVTLDFLATPTSTAPGLGGDNYPLPAYGENKVALRNATPATLPDTETFAAQGTEQDALAEYLKAFYAVTPYGVADTAPAGDLRIQNLAARADTVLAARPGERIDGGDAVDTLVGTAGNDYLSGLGGDDIIDGAAGADLLFGDAGSDRVNGGTGNDSLRGFFGNDTLFGELGNDFIDGEQDDDFIGAGSGDDYASGNVGNDAVYGEIGNDTLFGDAGDDYVNGGTGNDQLRGYFGRDTLVGEAGDDALYGEQDDDSLDAGAGNDALSGGSGNDTLLGGAGADLLFGNAGNDDLAGGAGRDIFAFGRGDGLDLIRDFVTSGSEADVIAFNGGAFADFAAVQAASRQEGADTVITLDADTRVTIQGVSLASLGAASFAFG
ncbi:5'-nucleotidase C-terminal domain-containing protein [uncultured Methylobacterium sp.]|jgi:2',3'-cyclic-nucleotide 2'-phosphodiesterase (5'-nucleotidase family)|uniref:5'-nucleotidase C-terminal domain-containing protein n=1 Tax=uncultured Methylobacterium sp. TaxID=157278 RepID=UPI002611F9D4|nr:5'-nucleotidase C-terminal domain-containing protein [uncultured Methylobacterium sp.]